MWRFISIIIVMASLQAKAIDWLPPRYLPKENVCTITINSSDEVKTFHKYLPAKNYNFTELTELPGATQKNWFQNACNRNVQCDILIVSGHFGGHFFGSSGKELSLDELEQKSCNDSCSGILKKPKEVFLFGCNTLAGKEEDSRTPQQYIHDLVVKEHYAHSLAESMAVIRYSPVGGSFHNRMQRVFSATPRIYGFSSIAPFGNYIKPDLRNYLMTAINSGYYETGRFDNIDKSPNKLLLTSLEETNITQTFGENTAAAPVCYIQSDALSREEKFEWIQKALEKETFWDSVPAINSFLESIDETTWVPGAKEQQALQKIMSNKNARTKVLEILAQPIDYMISTQVDLAHMSYILGWLTDTTYNKTISRLAFGTMALPFTGDDVDFVCSLNMKLDPEFESIPEARFNDHMFMIALGCAKPQNPKTLARLELATRSSNKQIAKDAAEILEIVNKK